MDEEGRQGEEARMQGVVERCDCGRKEAEERERERNMEEQNKGNKEGYRYEDLEKGEVEEMKGWTRRRRRKYTRRITQREEEYE